MQGQHRKGASARRAAPGRHSERKSIATILFSAPALLLPNNSAPFHRPNSDPIVTENFQYNITVVAAERSSGSRTRLLFLMLWLLLSASVWVAIHCSEESNKFYWNQLKGRSLNPRENIRCTDNNLSLKSMHISTHIALRRSFSSRSGERERRSFWSW